mmetsp:Transcript_29375/g.48835  ORF Transcript_29375/g.48835 Transcript_29375/m.48835 type:complete len:707 (-) Transcript_29375:291-2411(-)|eukprot:CAMPEP_0178747230 /NCGR_PEP_ID=MMETSP0744-20121128/8211_1 /TAXON_ID=913974 /ORGANISM="Nitzschia punctata, Strain CCMP561" /LENGTH=706 /DNA_ID=CAMNT_0020400453 /DNA_START=77 /DNA_END=2197 /DNA_ORIENTATION=+
MKAVSIFLAAIAWSGVSGLSADPAQDTSHHQEHYSLRMSSKDGGGDIHEVLSELLNRVEKLEDAVQSQATEINDLQEKLFKAESLHRFLQDTDEDCLPTYNATTRQCNIRNNYTFHEDVQFIGNGDFVVDRPLMNVKGDLTVDGKTKFYDDVRFERNGLVAIDKPLNVRDDVVFDGKYKSADKSYAKFRVQDDVKVEFEPKHRIEFLKDTLFKKYVKIQANAIVTKNLDVNRDLKVHDETHLHYTYIDGYLDVEKTATLYKPLYAKGGITAWEGAVIETGDLEVKHGGAHVFGDMYVTGKLQVLGERVYSGDVEITGKATVKGVLTAHSGAVIHQGSTPALKVLGKTEVSGDVDINKHLSAGSIHIDGSGDVLVVDGNAKVNGALAADQFIEYTPGGTTPELTTEAVVNALAYADVSVNSLHAKASIKLNHVNVATLNDIDNCCDQGTGGGTVDTCSCSTSDVVKLLEHSTIKADAVEADYFRKYINGGSVDLATVNDIPESSSGGGDCTCASDVADIVTSDFINSLGIDCPCEIPPQNTQDECSCDIPGIVTTDYISEMGFLHTDDIDSIVSQMPSSCTCSSGDVEDAVQDAVQDAISGLELECPCQEINIDDIISQLPPSSCTCTSSDVEDAVQDAMNGLELECPCEDINIGDIVSQLPPGPPGPPCTCSSSDVEDAVQDAVQDAVRDAMAGLECSCDSGGDED